MIFPLRTYWVIKNAIIVLFTVLFLFPENFTRSESNHKSKLLTHSEESLLKGYFMHNRVQLIDSLVQTYAGRTRFNGNLLVAVGGKIVYEGSVGFESYDGRIPLTKQSVFQLASVSKQFAAIAILMLHEHNRLDIDDLLSRYIPELHYQGVTIRHLLNHTAGLPDYLQLIENAWVGNGLPDNEELIRLLAEHQLPRFHTPGLRFNYSNTGYALLASVVERVTGNTFSTFLRQHFFTPLQMKGAFTSVEIIDSLVALENITKGHRSGQKRHIFAFPTIHDRILGDKGIFSSASDIFKWDQALNSGLFVNLKLLDEAFSPTKLPGGKTILYGYGFRLGERNHEKIVYHHGTWQGYRTSFKRYVTKDNTIIILNNVNQRFNNEIIEKIEDIIEAPFQPNPTQLLALKIIESGVGPSLLVFEKMRSDGQIVKPDSVTLQNVAWLLTRMNKPVSSKQVFEFSETIDLVYPTDPLAKPR
ncbi:MAG: serine hydrolase domain-containing protein [Bacteroidales bacterium]|nr:serine hydrolase domain-containing protein [Bacteroidales bacterium]MDZ4204564.1 serine hydrolase domain-containing protein [Bacteroidales bacterium]